MNLGTRIKELRISKGLTQQELSDKSNISRVAIGNYERGDRTPNIEIINKIATALDVTVSELLGPMYLFNGPGTLHCELKKMAENITNNAPFKADDFITNDYSKTVLNILADDLNCNIDLLSNEELEELYNKLKDTLLFEIFKIEKSKGIKLINEGEE